MPLGFYVVEPKLYYLVGQTIAHLAIAVCIDRAVRLPSGWLGRLLNARAVVFVGILSYSLYLWQEPFMNPFLSLQHISTAFPYNLILTVLMALGSYYLIERPFLKLRSAFRPV